MTFAQILADVYRRTGFASTPASDVVTRIKAFVNEVQQDLMSEAGMETLLNDTTTIASVVNQQQYGLPPVVSKIKSVWETTTNRTLRELSLGEYRAIYPNPGAVTGTPNRWVDLGFDALETEISDSSTIYIVSTNAADTQSAYIEGYLAGGYAFKETLTMNGTGGVASGNTNIVNITKFYLSSAALGFITLREDSVGGTVRAAINTTDTYSRYRRIALAPCPAAVITYNVEHERVATDMVNDTDQPLVPVQFHRMLAIGARAKEYEKQNQLSRWQLAIGEYGKELKKFKFWLYEQAVGLPNTRGTGYTIPSISEGAGIGVGGSSTGSPLAATSGGTGFSSYAVGDLLAADTASSLARLPDVATGKVLHSGGVGVAPLYGKVDLVADINSSLLPDANLSTNVPLKNGTNVFSGQNEFTTVKLLLSVGQLQLPSVQNASTDANCLDDYEEGTWVPVLGGSGGTSGQAYSVQVGWYVKIGKFVVAGFNITLSNKGTITTNLQIQGLPFTVENVSNAYSCVIIPYWTNLAVGQTTLGGYVTPGTTTANITGVTVAAVSMVQLDTNAVGATTGLTGIICYRASA